MASDSFFALFAQWVQPDVNRPATEGDFYGSPLRYLGIPLATAYQVNTAWMTSIKNMADMDEAKKYAETRRDYELKKKENVIIFSEALKQVYGGSVYENFFAGTKPFF